MRYFVICFAFLVVFSSISMGSAIAEEILILVENEVRKVYYTGENIVSVSFNPKLTSTIFETGKDARLEIQAPKVYKHYDPGLIVLRNGEEVDAIRESDECFYYLTFETERREKIEIVHAYWPEFPEVVENCESFTVPPLKQINLGVSPNEIQCEKGLVLITKSSDGSPACVTSEAKQKLIERGWALVEPKSADDPLPEQITKEVFLSMTVEEWKKMSPSEVVDFSNQYEEVFSYIELGRFLIKDEMRKELQRNGIENRHDDFRVFSGFILDSLPPHISFHAVVNATDGKIYLLDGGTFANKIESLGIRELVFYKDVLNPPEVGYDSTTPFSELFLMEPRVYLVSTETRTAVDPYSLVLNLEESDTVVFHNNLATPILIESINDPETIGGKKPWKTLQPNESGTIKFNTTGEYKYGVRFVEEPGSHGFGSIITYSNETKDLPFNEKLQIARKLIQHSDIPWTSMGLGNGKGVTISLNPAVVYMIPDAEKYYEAWAQRWVPYEVPIIIRET